MAYGDHIFRRNNGIFYFRQVFSLGALKKEIRISLHTRSKKEASVLAAQLHLKSKVVIHSSDNKNMDADALLAKLKEDLLKTVEQHTQNDIDRFNRLFSVYEEKVLWVKEVVSDEFQDKSISDVITIYDEFFPLFEEARKEKEESLKESRAAEILSRARAHYDIPTPSLPTVSPAQQVADTSILFSQLVKAYTDEMSSGGNWAKKTEVSNRESFSLFIELIGDCSIATINSADIRNFKKSLQNLPKNRSKLKETRDIPIKDLASMQHSFTTLAVRSINKHVTRISSLFGWAVKNGYMEKNLATGMTIKERKNKKESRLPFTDLELSQIFSSKPYQAKTNKHSYFFWLPLLGLYTGARINELCQLMISDIQADKDIPYFYINDEDDKRIKTESARRKIPIHSALIEKGFLDFVKSEKNKGHRRVFNSIKPCETGYGESPSKWFGRLKAKLELAQPDKKAFHSFRHNFSDALNMAEVPEHIAASILGHTHHKITYGLYGSDVKIEQLSEAIEKVEYSVPELKDLKAPL